MPLKIDSGKALADSGKITKEEIVELLTTYRRNTHKAKAPEGAVRPFDPKEDTKCAWFSLSEIVEFLNDNGAGLQPTGDLHGMGIRIYLGMHHASHRFQPQPRNADMPRSRYFMKDTPILVTTRFNPVTGKDEDQLSDGSSITLAPLNGGDGLDNARLCPPECDDTEL